ncbi:MAG: class I SAM-dependent methyltransferase [Bacteroidota bacterium]
MKCVSLSFFLVLHLVSLRAQVVDTVPLHLAAQRLRVELLDSHLPTLQAYHQQWLDWRAAGLNTEQEGELAEALWGDYCVYGSNYRPFRKKLTAFLGEAIAKDFKYHEYEALFTDDRLFAQLIQDAILDYRSPHYYVDAFDLILEVATYEIQPGMRVGEIGAGGGMVSLLLATAYDSLTLYVNEIKPYGVLLTEKLFKQTRSVAPNTTVQVFKSKKDDAEMDSLQLDVIIMRNVLHHFKFPEEMFASIDRALAPDGRLVIMEGFQDGEADTCPLKMTRAAILDQLTHYGYELLREYTPHEEEASTFHFVRRRSSP